jgi:large subunit ribosomal protein L2
MKLSFFRSVPSLRSGRVTSKNIQNRDLILTNRNRSSKNTSSRPAGRNHTGRITVRHQGGGHKQAFRSID